MVSPRSPFIVAIVITCLFGNYHSYADTYTSISSGDWSDTNIWSLDGGSTPCNCNPSLDLINDTINIFHSIDVNSIVPLIVGKGAFIDSRGSLNVFSGLQVEDGHVSLIRDNLVEGTTLIRGSSGIVSIQGGTLTISDGDLEIANTGVFRSIESDLILANGSIDLEQFGILDMDGGSLNIDQGSLTLRNNSSCYLFETNSVIGRNLNLLQRSLCEILRVEMLIEEGEISQNGPNSTLNINASIIDIIDGNVSITGRSSFGDQSCLRIQNGNFNVQNQGDVTGYLGLEIDTGDINNNGTIDSTIQYCVDTGTVNGVLHPEDCDAADIICQATITVLPIRWISFNAHAENEGIELTWEAIEEPTLAYYSIQRKAHIKNDFQDIGKKEPFQQQSEDLHQYTHSDISIPLNAEFIYYRIAAIGQDGSSHYSEVRAVENPFSADQSITIFPNPISSTHRNIISWNSDSLFDVSIYDSSGREVFKSENISSGIQLPFLNQGMYYILLKSDSKDYPKKLMVIDN